MPGIVKRLNAKRHLVWHIGNAFLRIEAVVGRDGIGHHVFHVDDDVL